LLTAQILTLFCKYYTATNTAWNNRSDWQGYIVARD